MDTEIAHGGDVSHMNHESKAKAMMGEGPRGWWMASTRRAVGVYTDDTEIQQGSLGYKKERKAWNLHKEARLLGNRKQSYSRARNSHFMPGMNE